MAHCLDRLVDGLLRTDDGDEVVLEQAVVIGRSGDGPLLSATQTGESQLSRDGLDNVAQNRTVLALHPNGAVDERGGRVLVTAAVAQCQQAEEQHADDAVEVGDGIGHGGVSRSGLVPGHGRGVPGRRQSWCVGDGAGERSRDHRRLEAEKTPHAHGCERRDPKDAQEDGQRTTGGTNDVEEVRPGLDADGEGEDRQSEGSQLPGDLDGS